MESKFEGVQGWFVGWTLQGGSVTYKIIGTFNLCWGVYVWVHGEGEILSTFLLYNTNNDKTHCGKR